MKNQVNDESGFGMPPNTQMLVNPKSDVPGGFVFDDYMLPDTCQQTVDMK